jgi:competence protein ComEA
MKRENNGTYKKIQINSALRAARPSPTLFICIFLLVPLMVNAAMVNINTASKGQLVSLKGIGEVKAQAIIEYREAHGPFDSIDDILNVQGIGPATFASIKDSISIDYVPPVQEKTVNSKGTATPAELTAATALTPSSASPVWYLAGLAAIVTLGSAGAWYARLQTAPLAETKPGAEEFDIE